MRSTIITMFILSALACDRTAETDFREGGSSSGGEVCELPQPPPIGTATETWACVCATDDDCKPGLHCVPLPGTKENRCFAPAFGETPGGGGYITSCKQGTEDRALFYPWGIGLSPIFCSACLSCEAPIDGSLICQ